MNKFRVAAITTAFVFLGIFAESCEAGPLLDWLRGHPSNAYRYNAFYRGPVAATPGYAQMPGTCTTSCPKTCYQTVNRVVANYVPYTAFRTEWYRVPVTYYRPQTTTNPQTGCITTCMKPCTYYQMQARRVPYTTYQTVYRTVQHRVPYTIYQTSYGNNCSSCSTCTSCGVNPAPVATPSPVQTYGLNTTGTSYGTPANTVPQLTPGEIQPDTTLQRPANEPAVPESDPALQPEATINSSHQQPRLNFPVNPVPVGDHGNTTASLVRGQWDYSPVSTARYQTGKNDSLTIPSPDLELSSGSKVSQPAFRSSGWKSSAR